ncbi:hypothetical protein FLA4_05710 [Candidatus Rickettsia kotlanii]|nr:hypothetical protein FLA4_05710 [Candidatus Rickettsia kotlanii]BDU61404.1 hypothetical protein HM2_05720 [Candidatus Rickettsia kotlanii]
MDKDIQSYIFINKLKSLPFVNEIWLFGSRARGDNDERSDIDIAIICPNITDQEWLRSDVYYRECRHAFKNRLCKV